MWEIKDYLKRHFEGHEVFRITAYDTLSIIEHETLWFIACGAFIITKRNYHFENHCVWYMYHYKTERVMYRRSCLNADSMRDRSHDQGSC